jgi:hypothetical protein
MADQEACEKKVFFPAWNLGTISTAGREVAPRDQFAVRPPIVYVNEINQHYVARSCWPVAQRHAQNIGLSLRCQPNPQLGRPIP